MTTGIATTKYKETEGRQFKSLPNCLFGALYVDGQKNLTAPLLFLLQGRQTLLIVRFQCEEVLVKHFKASR